MPYGDSSKDLSHNACSGAAAAELPAALPQAVAQNAAGKTQCLQSLLPGAASEALLSLHLMQTVRKETTTFVIRSTDDWRTMSPFHGP